MSNRVYKRIDVQGFQADISDGVGFFPGELHNVSRFGLCMTDLPQRIDETAARMTIVINGHGQNFKMLIRPKWSQKMGLRKTVGFEILNTPYEWTDFVLKIEPKDKRDSKGVIHM